jgi:DNA topoisomerase-2
MAGEEQVPMLPWWRGFKGEIRKVAEHKYDIFGVVRKVNDTTVEITELPIHKWTQSYKAELEAMCGEKGDGVIKVCSPSDHAPRGGVLSAPRTTRSTRTM